MKPDSPFVKIRPRTTRMGRDIRHLHDTDSTQAVARRLAVAGAPEGTLVVADRQTAGVGRLGRPWTTVGSALHMTIVLRPPVAGATLHLLPLAAGVALIEAARRLLKVDLKLKWPNDVLWNGRKVAGLLVEGVYASERPEFLLLGVGANGDAVEKDFPPELQASAASLSMAAGSHVCLPALVKIFLEEFERRYDALLAQDTPRIWQEARNLLGTIGRRVRVQTPARPIEGEAVDLGPQGELLVRAEGSMHSIQSGECEELRDA